LVKATILNHSQLLEAQARPFMRASWSLNMEPNPFLRSLEKEAFSLRLNFCLPPPEPFSQIPVPRKESDSVVINTIEYGVGV
jgi:hypothetical protein